MIFGRGSPVLQGLVRLSVGPIIISFGPGTQAVQPIAVEDLVRVLVSLIQDPPAVHETIEAGGKDVLPLIDLLRKIRTVVAPARGPARVLELPLKPIRGILAFLEPLLLPVLPLTAGQLATFANPGAATAHPLTDRFRSTMRPLEALLAECGPDA